MQARPRLIVVGGPTASGKTAAAVRLAQHFGTHVINADSRQFYHAMRIGTARPSDAELQGVPHHFLGHLDLDTTWSAGEFARAAEPVLQDLLQTHGTAILTGGSGLYIDALLFGLDDLPPTDPELRARLQARINNVGLPDLVAELATLDPSTHARIDTANPHRILRALEICLLTGKPFSEQRSTPAQRTDVEVVRLMMQHERAALYARIDDRVDTMIAQGLEAEARTLLPHRALNALRTVGYTELFEHFDGRSDRDTAIALIKQHTRNYAKRQLTWLRRAEWRPFVPTDTAAMIDFTE